MGCHCKIYTIVIFGYNPRKFIKALSPDSFLQSKNFLGFMAYFRTFYAKN